MHPKKLVAKTNIKRVTAIHATSSFYWFAHDSSLQYLGMDIVLYDGRCHSIVIHRLAILRALFRFSFALT